MTKPLRFEVALYGKMALNEQGRPIATIKITIISRNGRFVEPVGFFK